jgi:hypothetical protein
MVSAFQHWENFHDVENIACPVQFEKAELDKFLDTEDTCLKLSIAMDIWRRRVCDMNEEGWVRNEDFEEAKIKLAELTEEIWKECEGDEEDMEGFRKGWPWRDHEEVQ